MLRRLRAEHGPLMFHQSGGCCDGSSPMCFPDGEFITGDSDILLGELDAGTREPSPVWMSREQFALLEAHPPDHRRGPGPGGRLLPGGADRVRFLIRSRLLTDEEDAALDDSPATAVGAQLRP